VEQVKHVGKLPDLLAEFWVGEVLGYKVFGVKFFGKCLGFFGGRVHNARVSGVKWGNLEEFSFALPCNFPDQIVPRGNRLYPALPQSNLLCCNLGTDLRRERVGFTL